YDPGTVDVLAAKKGGRYLVLEVDRGFQPPAWESRELFGLRVDQESTPTAITEDIVRSGTAMLLPDPAVRDLMLAMVTARHTQSNSVTYVRDGMVLGVGAGQQSRIDCTRLAGAKVDIWWLRRHNKVRNLPFLDEIRRQERINWEVRYIEGDLDPGEAARFRSALRAEPLPLTPDDTANWIGRLDNVAVASDGYIPFRDNIDRAARHGVRYIADPGGSSRNQEVEDACSEHGITLTTTKLRLFQH
ncbi:MAG: 5-aminoimidazole-4-carboxamide ribonucleotide transformylase, partial [Acidimicrobiales bacterium]